MQILYKFEKPRKLEHSFVNSTTQQNLRQLYGIIGMAKFDYQIKEIIEDVVTIEIDEDLKLQFWTAQILASQFGNVKYKCILIS